MVQYPTFHEQIRYERERRGWSQADLAKRAGCDTKTVGRWERGERLPRPYHRQFLYELFGKDAEAFGLVGLATMSSSALAGRAGSATQQAGEDVPSTVRAEDWHEAPAVVSLYGREKELGELERWFQDQSCRVISVSGMGGSGKSALVATAATQVKEHFEYTFWRSLHAAPSTGLLLKQCLGFFSRQSPADLPEEVEELLSLLLSYLSSRRCLVVLDTLESIMQCGQRAGCYRGGLAAYGKLMKLFAETRHQSCLVLIGREKPQEVACREGRSSPVRALSLAGIDGAAGRELLKERGLFGTQRDWAELVERYSGNPLALQLASATVREVFGGSIARFLQEDVSAFGEISNLLGQHIHCLSDEEREILYWLAIEREGMSLEELRENLAKPAPPAILLELLDSLRRRSLIEIDSPAHFTLPAIFKEYVLGCLLERAYQEFMTETPGVWMSHALTRAKSKDYTCENRPCPLLAPLAQRLLATQGKGEIEERAQNLLAIQRQQDTQHPGYFAANILSLLDHAGCELLSNLPL